MYTTMTTIYSMKPGSGNRICNFVRQSTPQGIVEQLHTHDYIKVMHITGGKAEWVVNDTCHILESGTFVILNDTELRGIRSVCSPEPLTLEWIQFQPLTIFSQMPVDACTRICSIFYLRPPGFSNRILPGTPHSTDIATAFAALAEDAEHSDALQDDAMIGDLYRLLIAITRHYIAVLGPHFLQNKMASARNFQKLADAIRYIQLHYAEDITENQVSEHLHISCSYFSYLFKTCYGVSFRAYLRQYRMEKTLALLHTAEESGMTVLDAALSCGFSSASGFYKCLHDLYGTGNVKELLREERR